jgi:uncharacterized protein (DUF302 family)
MAAQSTAYGKVVTTSLGYHDAVDRAKEILKDEGFGVLCEIDVAQTLLEKIGAEFAPYRILGACNPQFAHQALSLEPQLGLLLPCNVVVQVENGKTVVSAIDARALLGIVGNDHLLGVADEVNTRLGRVLDRIAEM